MMEGWQQNGSKTHSVVKTISKFKILVMCLLSPHRPNCIVFISFFLSSNKSPFQIQIQIEGLLQKPKFLSALPFFTHRSLYSKLSEDVPSLLHSFFTPSSHLLHAFFTPSSHLLLNFFRPSHLALWCKDFGTNICMLAESLWLEPW